MIRLSKRMGTLDLCSRREADRWIREGRVTVDGEIAMIGHKVPEDLDVGRIAILDENNQIDGDNNNFENHRATNPSSKITVCHSVVLNKPTGFVSGQAEHGHPPAIRLLTRDRLWDHQHVALDDSPQLPATWKGFAPAGRLDRDSTGLLIFSSSGVMAKKLISDQSVMEKEYLVQVEPAHQVSRREREFDESFELPNPTLDLSPLLDGGRTLLGKSNHKPLLPCQGEWVEPGKYLKLILKEGRKQHIRRACRELLGYHVLSLQRVRIGPVHLKNSNNELPEGCWRPLTANEVEEILK